MPPDQLTARSVLFHGFSDPSRLAIIEALRRGGRRATDLARDAGLSQPNASAHLACLRECGLVTSERRGREVHYRLLEGVDELLSLADRLVEQAGGAVEACSRYGRRRRAA
ncbi:ArsR/SmtB family transcription factor [Miltoncostaea marina]|uniref:ArsR/SmtB family transcription factor n=1 Tax=Miltoncostaea marina TaxID=2843215 RepID=UPI001C3C4A9B|nr:metalloregulator ArsR/SmtB family transcription factor [Miltoncostaea marina]